MRSSGLARLLFGFSCLSMLFGYGVLVGHYEVFPYSILEFGKNSVTQLYKEKENLLGLRPTEFLQAARYQGSGVTRHQADQSTQGLTLLSGLFDDGNEIRLIRSNGSIVNRWPVQFFDLFSDPTHIKPATSIPKTNWNSAVHGALALPDGSVIFNFTYQGTVKLDRCGAVQWTVPRMTHHSVERASEGGFWVPGARYVEADSPFLTLRPPYIEDTLLKVSEDGEVLEDISLLEILFKNNLQGFIHSGGVTGDLTHLNDIEELGSGIADRFPQFATGDLLLSLRRQNLVMVVSPETLAVKWHQAGPWIGQHDPDFLPNGRISVFNNNDDGTPTGSAFGGSNIMEVNPASGAIEIVYPVSSPQRMFTRERGKHQRLDLQGNTLITEADAGRAFEVDSKGEIVWEFINRYDETDVALVTEATRYPEGYFTPHNWACGQKSARR